MQFEILILITSICYLERSRLNQGRWVNLHSNYACSCIMW